MGFNPFRKKSLWDDITNAVGAVADKVIPGNQSSWHDQGQAPAPAQRPQAPIVTNDNANFSQQQQPDVLSVITRRPDSASPFNTPKPEQNSLSVQPITQTQSITQPKPVVQPNLTVATAPVVQPKINVPVNPNPAPAPEKQNFIGYDMTNPKNKTILGMNAAWALPKNYEKTYDINVGRNYESEASTFENQYKNMDDDVKKIYEAKVKQMAADGNYAAQNTLAHIDAVNGRKNIIDRASDVGGKVGDVTTGMAEGIYHPIHYLGEGLGTIAGELGPAGNEMRKNQEESQKIALHTMSEANRIKFDPNSTEAQKAHAQKMFDQAKIDLNQQITDSEQHITDVAAKTDKTKLVASTAEIAASLLTLGVGTGGTAAADTALATGGKAALAKELAMQGVKTGVAGAVPGAIDPFTRHGKDTTASEVIKGGATGFALSAPLPLVSYGVHTAVHGAPTSAVAGQVAREGENIINHGTGSVISDVLAEKNPAIIKQSLGNIPDSVAEELAKETDKAVVEQTLKQLELDPNVHLSDDVRKRLQDEGITSVKVDPNAQYNAQYDRNGNVVVKDPSQATPDNIYHEVGHSIYQNRLSAEEKAAFANINGEAAQQGRLRQGYTPDDIASEDFSNFTRMALDGNISQVPQEVRGIVAKYAKVALDEGAPSSVLHLPEQGVHAKVDPYQLEHLKNETENIPWSTNDRPHLTAGNNVITGSKEVSQDEIRKLSQNAATALDNVPAPIEAPIRTPAPNNLGLEADAQARFGNRPTPDVAEEIAAKYGGDKASVQRNIDRYGAEQTNNMYARKSDALPFNPDTGEGIKNIDAVVTSELKKANAGKVRVTGGTQSPEELASLDATAPNVNAAPVENVAPETPTVAPTQVEAAQAIANNGVPVENPAPVSAADPTARPSNVNAATGEIQTIEDQIKTLPDHNTATLADGKQIEGYRQNMNNHLDQVAENLDPAAVRKMQTEITQYLRSGSDPALYPSPESVALYNDNYKGIADALGETRRSQGGKISEFYIPEMHANSGIAGSTSDLGYGLVSDVDKEFGFNMKRENKIPVDELADPSTAFKKYNDQYTVDRYGHLSEAQDVVDRAVKNNAERTAAGLAPNPVPTEEQALAAVNKQKALGAEIATQAEKGGLINSGAEHLHLVDDIGQIGQEKGVPQFNVDQSLSRGGRLFKSSDELYNAKYVDANGVEKTIAEGTGWTRFNDADAIAYTLQDKAYAGGALNEQALSDELKAHLNTSGLEPRVVDHISDWAIKKLKQYDTTITPEMGADTIAMDRGYILARAEKNVAREQMVQFLEGANVASPQLKKNLEQDAAKMLIHDRAVTSLAEKIVNGSTSTVYKGALGYNPISALQNVTEFRRAYAQFGEKGFADAVSAATRDPKIVQRYGVKELFSGKGAEDARIEAVAWKDLLKPMGIFNATEEMKDAILLHGLENQHAAAGLTGTDLTSAVMKDFKELGFKGGKGGSLGFNKSKTGRIMGQFMQYQLKDWKLTAGKVGTALGKDGVTEAEKTAAQKYLARKLPADVATYLGLSAAYGATWQSVLNFQNPFASNYVDPKAGTDEKVVNVISGIGGPIPGVLGDLYGSIRAAQREADTNGESLKISNVVNNRVKHDAALLVPGGNQIFNKTGAFIADQRRGYDESSKGKARYGASTDPLNIARGIIAGKSSTDKAREYYGKSGIGGDIKGLGGDQLYPVDRWTQGQIQAAGGDKTTINQLIDNNHEGQIKYTEVKSSLPKDQQTTFDQLNGRGDTVLKDSEKAALYFDNPKILEAMNNYNGTLREKGLPNDPVYSLPPDQQNVMFHYLSELTGSKDKKATMILNPWIKDVNTERSAFFDQVKNPDSKKPTDQRIPEYPTATGDLGKTMDTYYGMTDKTAKGQFMSEHPEISDQLTRQSDWVNEVRKAHGAPEFDSYPTPDVATKKYMDAYNALPKGDGPLKKDGTPSSPARSAWITAHPQEFAALTSQWNKQALWSLQNGLSESVYKGIDPSESDIKDIASLGSALNGGSGGYSKHGGSGGASLKKEGSGSFGSTQSIGLKTVTVNAPKVTVKTKGQSKKTIKVTRGGKI